MKQRSENLRGGDGKSVLIIFVVSILIISPVVFWGIPFGNKDFFHHLQLSNAFYESLRQGIWFPNWVFQENSGYGAVTVRFYPPLMPYTLAIFRFLTGDWQSAIFAGFSFWSFVGGLGIFLWTREFFNRRWQLTVAAVLFVLSPYHLNQFYNSFMYGEFAALSVMPFGFYFARKVCRRGSLADVLGVSVALSLIVLSNLPQAVVGTLCLGVYILLNIKKANFFSVCRKFAVAGLLTLACSAFYSVRLVNEINWINISQPNTDPAYDFRNHFLLHDFSFDSGGVWFASLIFTASILLAVSTLLLSGKTKAALQNKNVKDILILSGAATFMMMPLSKVLWEHLHFLQKIQFPWRFLSVLTIGVSILTAFSLEFINFDNLRRKRPLILLLTGAIFIFLTFSVKQVALGALFLEPENIPSLVESSITGKGLWHWQTVWSKETAFDEKGKTSAAGRKTEIIIWESETREFSVEPGASVEARLAVLYYPHWQAFVNGNRTEISPSSDGAVSLRLPEEKSEVKLTFVEPRSSLLSRKISIVAWSIVLLLLLFHFFRYEKFNSE